MLATNSVIIKINTRSRVKELKINLKISVIRTLDIEKLKKEKDKKIIILQDIAQYSNLKRLRVQNVSYNPIYNVSLYIDDEEFEEIKQDIINYCYENFIEIEIYEADDIEEAIEQLKADNEGEYALILTKQKVDMDKLKN